MIQILVIDDEDPIRNLLARMIELEGYKVWKASDCQSALKLLKAQPFDVVLCDVFLPDVWGIERSGFFNGREKWAKGFENQRV